MVVSWIAQASGVDNLAVIVAPNNSLSPRGALVFFLGICCASIIIAAAFAALGYWPILPFAGAELCLLGLVLWLSRKNGSYREVICLSDDTVRIVKGIDPVAKIEFSRHWASVEFRDASGERHSRLLIRSRGRACELAHCLTDSERRQLWRHLCTLIGPINNSPDLARTADITSTNWGSLNSC